ncbi:hypothetical protein [Microbacterium sp. NPDC057944]|uniref:hypothetical protein n=1 Tax=Microbacterium sp. NPDC057944 TaxID=3346286 RepID=UPI0036DF67B5
MAKIDVQFAFVEDVLSNERGVWALKTSEPHSRKNDRDEWETVSRTFRTVRAGKDSGLLLDTFAKGDRISFAGTEKTDVREHQGRKFYDLLVWADSISIANGRPGGQSAPNTTGQVSEEPWQTPGAQTDGWATQGGFGDETPF